MHRKVVSAFPRIARLFAVVAVVLGLSAGALWAQGSGKVEGRIRDQAGAPIANAQVTIPGTAFGALTNNQGYYFFNNVPVGTVAIRAAFVGYKSAEAQGIRVLAGQTVTQDIQLEQTPFQVDEITVTAAAVPLVPRDEVTTKQRLDGAYVEALPADRIENILAIQPGVVATVGNSISIRGGRSDQAATYVDGVPTSPGFRGTGFATAAGSISQPLTGISVATNAFEQASVTTGASSAEFGNSQSGIINIETRSGGQTFKGNVQYETDEPFGVNQGQGFNRISASLGGPTGIRNLTFFMSGVLEGRQSIAAGNGISNGAGFDSEKFPIFIPVGIDTTVAVPSAVGDPNADTTFVAVQQFAISRGECDTFSGNSNPDIADNYGFDCTGVRQPGSASTVYQTSAKLNYTFGSGNRLFLGWQGGRNHGRNPGGFNNPQNITGFRVNNNNLTLGWTQNLSKSADRALAIDAAVSYQMDRQLGTILTRESELNTRSPFGGFILGSMDFLWDFDNWEVDDQLVRNFRDNNGGVVHPLDLRNASQYALINRYRNSPYGVLGASESGGPFGFLTMFRENRLIGKANLDWQFDRYNRVKLGGDFTRYDITNYSTSLDDLDFSEIYKEQPIRYSAFLEDRLDLGDVVVVGGVRYDYYNSRAARPFVLDTVAGNATFGQYSYFPTPNSYGQGGASFNGQPLVKFVEDQSHDYLSPHIQVSFPVTDRTNFRLSYAHQVQAPDFSLILGGINTDLRVTNTNHVYGSDLDFGKTIAFEFGIRHAFSDDMVLDLSAFNKDNLSDAAGRLVSFADPARLGENVDIRILTNKDFGNTRGIDVRLDRRIGRFFNGVLAYTFQDAKNTGSDPFTFINFGSRIISQIAGGNQPPPQSIFPTGNSRPHSVTGSFALTVPSDWKQGSTMGSILRGVGVTALFRYASGTAYTRCPQETGNEGVISGQVCSRQFEGDFFGARLPSSKQLDMKFTKGFALGGMDITAYLDARNILNFRNIIQVFTTTNDVVNRTEQIEENTADSASFAGEAIANGVYGADGSIDLRFGGAVASGCGNWVNAGAEATTPNCVYLIRAEERYGNGDHIFTLDEQMRASDAAYFAVGGPNSPARGIQAFTDAPRRLRLGFEVNF
jgi:Carboxypeptidase regulatory-like domain/TonB-dependent Receptor Plug Domain